MSNATYRCTDCGKERASIGRLHAHIDARHYGIGPFNILSNPLKVGDRERLMRKTEIVGADGGGR